jgi:hypothetical protein
MNVSTGARCRPPALGMIAGVAIRRRSTAGPRPARAQRAIFVVTPTSCIDGISRAEPWTSYFPAQKSG